MLIDRTRMQLKLADFGLARAFSLPARKYSQEVVTLWYRAPELLLGADDYSSAIDMWAVGCIFAEMAEGRALFQGMHETEQLIYIFQVTGTPHEGMWPGVDKLFERNWVGDQQHGVKAVFPKFSPAPLHSVASRLAASDPQGLDLLSQMLRCSPSRRITAEKALKHAYFHDIGKILGWLKAAGRPHLGSPPGL
ncbi:unnamed protein product [Ostreobium quekettii]|uniref:cyclin-dependent kinase n=1 Tax=Ostreobium quekettii TaxID=121088 RepID=A0A8S1ISM3_9CHLO|nr:unnamed protein product [Ostreobium quekettii]|eukprot:evm.model.scf_380EXC.7 EVM.evm.TU.scf_380EXC.7   scf_380EXC:72721-75655(-)